MCVTHLTRSISTCCFPLPLLFACLAWCCNCSSFSLPLTGTSKGAVFWRISGGFAPFQLCFSFSLLNISISTGQTCKKWRCSFFSWASLGEICGIFKYFLFLFSFLFFLPVFARLFPVAQWSQRLPILFGRFFKFTARYEDIALQKVWVRGSLVVCLWITKNVFDVFVFCQWNLYRLHVFCTRWAEKRRE